MNEYVFDHDRLDVYRLSIESTGDAFKVSQNQKRRMLRRPITITSTSTAFG